uniref:Methyltransferase n=1 Tax=Paulinella longichromatophora TaxID=1708747 RepID=A0A2H4ZQF3_9EUKA|nr:hypothetical protein PLO_769 [Paulinella longichromatophora]
MRLNNGRKLKSPKGVNTRPTTSRVRLATMNILESKIVKARWLDLFCGSGIMSCEALIYGATAIVSIDRDYDAVKTSRYNLQTIQKDIRHPTSVALYKSDVLHWLDRRAGDVTAFDVIYMDPPYLGGMYEATLNKIAEGRWINTNGLLVVECNTSTFPINDRVWNLVNRRHYGKTSILYFNLREQHHDGTDSKPQ